MPIVVFARNTNCSFNVQRVDFTRFIYFQSNDLLYEKLKFNFKLNYGTSTASLVINFRIGYAPFGLLVTFLIKQHCSCHSFSAGTIFRIPDILQNTVHILLSSHSNTLKASCYRLHAHSNWLLILKTSK